MSSNLKTIIILLIILITINVIGISVLIYSKSSKTDNWSYASYSKNRKKNEIQINFKIMDIYRIDMSCDFIVTALSGKINEKYKNKEKKCSYSSMNSIDDLISKSIVLPSENSSYSPSLTVDLNVFDSLETTNNPYFKNLKTGGIYLPKLTKNPACSLESLDNLAFIVPYTNSRLENLKVFLFNMHNYLQTLKHQFKYRILVVKQNNELNGFNKGRLYNAAVNFLVKHYSKDEIFDCMVLHDIDLIPSAHSDYLKQLGDYRCRIMPNHLSRKVLNLASNQVSFYNQFLTGGILSLRLDHFIAANGFSNQYFGWGGEDGKFSFK